MYITNVRFNALIKRIVYLLHYRETRIATVISHGIFFFFFVIGRGRNEGKKKEKKKEEKKGRRKSSTLLSYQLVRNVYMCDQCMYDIYVHRSITYVCITDIPK